MVTRQVAVHNKNVLRGADLDRLEEKGSAARLLLK
jgi:hypothetical protein